MADVIVIDVVEEVSRILTASDVVVEEFAYSPTRADVVLLRQNHECKADSSEGRLEEALVHGDVEREWSLSRGDDMKELVSTVVESSNVEDGTREDFFLLMKYHQRKVDSIEGRLEEPLVDGDVERWWNLSGGDDLKELVSTVLESTNVKAIHVFSDCRSHDVIEQFLQGLRTNHTIVSAKFHLVCLRNTMIVLSKSAVMLRHNIGLKSFSLWLPSEIKVTTKHSGFGNALKMNHTLQSLSFRFNYSSIKLDLEELVEPLIMDENGHQANSTLTDLGITFATELSTMSLARMLRKNSSIKSLDLKECVISESDVQELIRSLVENHSLETLILTYSGGGRGFVFPTIMDVLQVNLTLKDIKLSRTPWHAEAEHLAIKEQLQKNEMYKVLYLKELQMAKPTSARVIFCGSPYAGIS
jgi:hypothetical protein